MTRSAARTGSRAREGAARTCRPCKIATSAMISDRNIWTDVLLMLKRYKEDAINARSLGILR